MILVSHVFPLEPPAAKKNEGPYTSCSRLRSTATRFVTPTGITGHETVPASPAALLHKRAAAAA